MPWQPLSAARNAALEEWARDGCAGLTSQQDAALHSAPPQHLMHLNGTSFAHPLPHSSIHTPLPIGSTCWRQRGARVWCNHHTSTMQLLKTHILVPNVPGIRRQVQQATNAQQQRLRLAADHHLQQRHRCYSSNITSSSITSSRLALAAALSRPISPIGGRPGSSCSRRGDLQVC